MTALNVDDLAVITGPLTYGTDGQYSLHDDLGDDSLIYGEVVRVIEGLDDQGDAYVYGQESDQYLYISASSLTPLSEIQSDDSVKWGDLLDPDYVHDFVWAGEE